MKKAPWLPRTDAGKCEWFDNAGPKLPGYAATLEITAPELATFAADHLAWDYICSTSLAINLFGQDWIAYKKSARTGPLGSITPMPEFPALAPPPPAVSPDIWGRVTKLMGRLKTHPDYTDAMGEDLGIVGAETTIDLNNVKPALRLSLQAGHPVIAWKKNEMTALEIQVDRGTGTFAALAIDTEPDYLDTAPLPAPGTSATWRYRAIYRFHDEQVGQWSDVASIGVMG